MINYSLSEVFGTINQNMKFTRRESDDEKMEFLIVCLGYKWNIINTGKNKLYIKVYPQEICLQYKGGVRPKYRKKNIYIS